MVLQRTRGQSGRLSRTTRRHGRVADMRAQRRAELFARNERFVTEGGAPMFEGAQLKARRHRVGQRSGRFVQMPEVQREQVGRIRRDDFRAAPRLTSSNTTPSRPAS